MSPFARFRTWHPTQQWLRIVIVVGPVVALLGAGPAGNGPPAWAVVLVAATSVWWALVPESLVGLVPLATVLLWWTRVPDDALHPVVLVAAVAFVAAHVAALVAAAAPPVTAVDPAVARLWVRRTALLLAVVPVLWVLARALRGEAAPAGLWPAALVAVLVAVVALTAGLRREEEA